MRHDNLKKFDAYLLQIVCNNDVEIEPGLQLLNGETFENRDANERDEAQLDIRVRGFRKNGQSAHFDVCGL